MITFKEFLENSPKVFFHVTPKRNYLRIKMHGLVPSVGTRSAKVGEEPKIFLFTNKESMEDAVINWLAAEFDEDEEFVVLKVSLPKNFPILVDGGEVSTTSPIPPEYIQLTDIKV